MDHFADAKHMGWCSAS